jgi:TRAP-type C4-dicarboxylate transport system substrate-binding protein
MQTNCLKALGAEPVFMPMDQVYLSLENGSVDGVVTCPTNFLSYSLYEVANYATLATFGCVSEGLFMNKDSWNRTPEDLKPVIMEICHNPYRTTKGLNESDYTRMIDQLAESGVVIYDLPPEEAERWYSRFQDASRQWAEDMEAKGLPGKEAIKIFNEECKERGIRCVAFPEDWR